MNDRRFHGFRWMGLNSTLFKQFLSQFLSTAKADDWIRAGWDFVDFEDFVQGQLAFRRTSSSGYNPAMDTQLSAEALALLHACDTGDNPRVDADNIESYRELADAGVMYPVSGFRHGPEAMFRFTESGWRDRLEILARTAVSPAATS